MTTRYQRLTRQMQRTREEEEAKRRHDAFVAELNELCTKHGFGISFGCGCCDAGIFEHADEFVLDESPRHWSACPVAVMLAESEELNNS